MKSYNNIGTVMKNVLTRHTTPVSFESVWNADASRKKNTFGLLIAIIITITLCVGGFAGYAVFRKVDNTNYSFINDDRVIGKWMTVDFVEEVEGFNPNKKAWDGEPYLTSLAFIRNGLMLFAVGKDNLRPASVRWTKDLILSDQDKTASKYIIKEIHGIVYLFFEWKSGDYSFRNRTPWYYVLKKADNKDYSTYQIKQIKKDDVNYPFVDDPKLKGKWESTDFVEKPEDYKAGQQLWRGDLFIKKLHFEENGKLTITTTSETWSTPCMIWTKGLILNKTDETASKCEIKEINGAAYLFFEWKSGDYIYGGQEPCYYVLRKTPD